MPRRAKPSANAGQAQKESERKEVRRMKKESDEILMDRDKRELWEIENAQDTQNYLRQPCMGI
jgi:hypothetical protein